MQLMADVIGGGFGACAAMSRQEADDLCLFVSRLESNREHTRLRTPCTSLGIPSGRSKKGIIHIIGYRENAVLTLERWGQAV